MALDERLHAPRHEQLVERAVHALLARGKPPQLTRYPRRVELTTVRVEAPTHESCYARVCVWHRRLLAGLPQPRRDLHWQSLVPRIGARQMSQQLLWTDGPVLWTE